MIKVERTYCIYFDIDETSSVREKEFNTRKKARNFFNKCKKDAEKGIISCSYRPKNIIDYRSISYLEITKKYDGLGVVYDQYEEVIDRYYI
jgi:hypothetical protein